MSISTKTDAERLASRSAEATQLRIDKKILLACLAEIQFELTDREEAYAKKVLRDINTAVLSVRK